MMSNSQGWFLIFSVLLFGSSVTQIDKTPCHPVNLGGLCDNLREKYFRQREQQCKDQEAEVHLLCSMWLGQSGRRASI